MLPLSNPSPNGTPPKEEKRVDKYREFYEHSIEDTARILGLTHNEVKIAQRTGLEKVRASLLADPSIAHTFAHEADEKEITACFRSNPWCRVLQLVDGTIILKHNWYQKLRERDELLKTQIEAKNYNIT